MFLFVFVVISLIQGGISTVEMSRTFNCGIGFVLIASGENASSVVDQLRQAGEPSAAVIGSVINLNTGVHQPLSLGVCMRL